MNWNSRTSRPRSSASGKPGRSRASRPNRNRGQAGRARTRRTGSFQIVAGPEMNAVEHAFADLHILLAEVGDGFKFLHDAGWDDRRRRRGAFDRRAPQPFPKPAGFQFVKTGFANENGVLAFAAVGVFVFRPEIKLVYRLL